MVRIVKHLKLHRTLQKNKTKYTKTLLKQIIIAAFNGSGLGQCSKYPGKNAFFLLKFLLMKIKPFDGTERQRHKYD